MNDENLKNALDELAALKQSAQDAAETYKEGVESVAGKYDIAKGAINKYITARLAEKLEKLEEEASDIGRLVGI